MLGWHLKLVCGCARHADPARGVLPHVVVSLCGTRVTMALHVWRCGHRPHDVVASTTMTLGSQDIAATSVTLQV